LLVVLKNTLTMHGPKNTKDQTQCLTVALRAVGNCSTWLFPRDKECTVLCILVLVPTVWLMALWQDTWSLNWLGDYNISTTMSNQVHTTRCHLYYMHMLFTQKSWLIHLTGSSQWWTVTSTVKSYNTPITTTACCCANQLKYFTGKLKSSSYIVTSDTVAKHNFSGGCGREKEHLKVTKRTGYEW